MGALPPHKCSKTAGQDMWQGIIGYEEGVGHHWMLKPKGKGQL
jgi:hypothetical protein